LFRFALRRAQGLVTAAVYEAGPREPSGPSRQHLADCLRMFISPSVLRMCALIDPTVGALLPAGPCNLLNPAAEAAASS
jgi:hypothetical protein